ncbi:hypothetical protein TIFTF001_019304 [Ficus carica]|uniref:Pentatricopeptide repeat-containing protein n=1 Tax=Ficus carica TaxID=3494 RepID=A0AA88AG16_FICCA|nr:hypothetical protein TIFTF001_019304 [Ficus carica]
MTSSVSSQALGLLISSSPHPPRLARPKKWRSIVTMKDRSNNPRPLQKGRNLSIEAIQTVQSLKRAQKNHGSLEKVFDSKFRRLLKFDMMAVSLYADMVGVFGGSGFIEKVELVYLYLKREANLQPEIEGFNALLKALISLNMAELAMECYCLMKQIGCDPDRTTFRILVNGLESMGETGSSAAVRLDAQKFYGESLEFLDEAEDLAPTH